MAKTWTVTEAYNAIKTNDKEGIADFGKRFPLATTALAKSGVNDGMDMLMSGMPERVTMRILEMQLKDGVTVSDDDDATEEVAEEKPVKAEKKEKAAKTEKAEKTEKKAEKPKKATKKAEPVEEDDDEEDEAPADETPDYKSMGAVDLFKLCKKRGIKVEPKQKASVYIKALEAADNGSDDEDADEGDDWDI